MLIPKETDGNVDDKFDQGQIIHLGKYVYALKDPRDGKVFYVGQGTDERVFSHFKGARARLKDDQPASSKELRILDIWRDDADVEWSIIAYALKKDEADRVESATIDALRLSQNGDPLNEINGKHSTFLSKDELAMIAAAPINPEQKCKVMIFSITKTANSKSSPDDIYKATRMDWKVAEKYRNPSDDYYAVGLVSQVSIGGYKIKKWKSGNDGRWRFERDPEEASFLVKKNWKNIIYPAMGYFQLGNYLIVEFDGNGKFRFLRGGGTNSEWHSVE
ncbi:hypothetical protein AGMMS49944_16110 [Spirochaetia bacterium]|nr:hypothetical protein AGMMS49944_16110 [Spirochaetia bacterium]